MKIWGLTYLGPVDGHNMRQMMKLFNEAKRVEGPVVVHVLTKKGRGYEPASAHPDRFHGTGPFDIKTGRVLQKKTVPGYTDVFSKALVSLGEKNKKTDSYYRSHAGWNRTCGILQEISGQIF